MSDFADFTVTYTTVSSPYEGRSGDVSPGVDGPSVMPKDSYAYVVAVFQALPLPDYVPGPEEPKQADDDDDEEEEEHLASADSIPPPPALPSPSILPIPLPAASPPLQLLSSDRRVDRLEVTFPPRKRLSIVHCPGYEEGESSVAAAARLIEGRRADYGFVDSVEAEIRRRRAEDIRYVQEQDTQDIYGVMEDTQGMQMEIFQRVEALVNDSQYHYETGRLVDQKKMAPKKAATKQITRLNPGATSIPNQAPSTTTTTVTNAQLQAMIDQGVNAALAACDANRTGDDSHRSGTGVRRTERVTRECTYQDFMKCQLLYFKGTEGVVKLTQWFERMETVFRISNCLAENHVKFATCTLLADALT
nr:hypothetical protein [Tanacetum cinerariifolium]